MIKLESYIQRANKLEVPLSTLVIDQEINTLSLKNHKDINQDTILNAMENTYDVMRNAIESGLKDNKDYIANITGNVSQSMKNYLTNNKFISGKFNVEVINRALSASKANSMMHVIVAAPTAGSSGILPAVLTTIEDFHDISKEKIVRSLFTAGLIAKVIASQVTLAGAAGGCMAECGSASAMAAAAIVETMDGTPEQCSHAAALALKQHLGLVCDPIASVVECPCIKRNAMSATISIASAEMVLAGITSIVPFDEVLMAMKDIAEKMDKTLKETSLGGLASTPTGKKLTRIIEKKK